MTNLPDGPARSVLLMFDTGVGHGPSLRSPASSRASRSSEGELVGRRLRTVDQRLSGGLSYARRDIDRGSGAARRLPRRQHSRVGSGSKDRKTAGRWHGACSMPRASIPHSASTPHTPTTTCRRHPRRSRGMAELPARATSPCTFFDIDLLARKLVDRGSVPRRSRAAVRATAVPGLGTYSAPTGIRKHPLLEGIENSIRDSVWSLFDAPGVNKVRQAMQTREVR